MSSIGVSITDEFIRAIEFKPTTHGLELGRYSEKKIPEGIIESGEILKKKELVEILSDIKKEFGYSFVRASLPEEKTYVFRTELPSIPDEAIPGSIEFKIQENVPLSPAESVFDYSVIGREKDRIGVSVTVVPQTLVAFYTDAFRQAGLVPISFKVESQAIARAIIPNGDMTNALIVNFNDKRTGFYVVSKGVIQFASTLQLGADSLTSLVERHFNISHEKALEMKRTKSFAKDVENSELMYSMASSLSVIKDEISKVQAYWRSNTAQGAGEQKLEKIILCGEDVVLAGIDRYLSLNIGMPVEVAKVWSNAFDVRSRVPELPLVDSLNYASAIGLALGPRRNRHNHV